MVVLSWGFKENEAFTSPFCANLRENVTVGSNDEPNTRNVLDSPLYIWYWAKDEMANIGAGAGAAEGTNKYSGSCQTSGGTPNIQTFLLNVLPMAFVSRGISSFQNPASGFLNPLSPEVAVLKEMFFEG